MSIKLVETSKNLVMFSTLAPGDTFKYNNCLYLKTINSDYPTAVNLLTGYTLKFFGDDLVVPVSLELRECNAD